MGLLIGQCGGPLGQLHEPGGLRRGDDAAVADAAWTTVTGRMVEVHPTFLYESLWNMVGLLLIVCCRGEGPPL